MMESIKRLRETTGAGMMDVKKALQDASGDEEQAVALLRERGIVKAATKASREASDGLVRAFVTPDHKAGAIVEVNSETDFVARNEEFRTLVADLARFVAEHGDGGSAEGLSAMPYGDGRTVDEVMKTAIARVGENLVLHRAARFQTTDGFIGSYVHANDKIAVLVEVEGAGDHAETLAKDLTLHIAAERPRFLTRDEVDASALEKEREILTNAALNEGKPAGIVEKIVQGQLSKFYESNVLLEQKFVKDNSVNVKSLLMGGARIVRFARFEIGLR